MRRIPFPSAALAVGLVVLLTGCAGETPTSPSSSGGGGNSGSCTVSITMTATSQTPVVGTEVLVRAAVTKGGTPVPDGTSVQVTTDLGIFAENGLQTVSKTTLSGNADVTLYSINPGVAHVKATYGCGASPPSFVVTYAGVATLGPYISSFQPMSGSCAGGDTVTILGGLFGTTVGSVFFGGAPGSIVSWANTSITVTTPIHTLKNPLVPETVNLIVVAAAGQTQPVQFTYFCVASRMSVSSIAPTAGSPSGGDNVTILGSHFGTNIATTQVTFCNLPAQITGQSDTQITVTTPAHTLVNPALSESCPVVVTRDLGLVSVQSATAPLPFIYKGSGAGGACNADPTFYVSSLTPDTGTADGGTVVTITGNGFPTNPGLLLVTFGGTPGTIVGTPTTTGFQVSSPRFALPPAAVSQTVDVIVTDLGSATQRCYRVSGGFIYTAVALDPSVYSVSPRTGPNDQSTRTTIFGANFQFPMQVFLTGGTPGPGCGAQRVEAAVISVAPTQIVFSTPVAAGGNACLANQLVDVVVLNPSTGKTATCAACFKYYSCPTVGGASPSVGDATQSTTVVITGNNFTEPVVANFSNGTSTAPLQVTSVSNTSILVTLPPLQSLFGGALSCGNTAGSIQLTFPSLTCTATTPLSVPFTYFTNPPTATSASPNASVQAGGTTISVVGKNFAAPMTVQMLSGGTPVGIPVLANVSNPTAMTFVTPSLPDSAFLKVPCAPGGSGPLTGTQSVSTVFGIRVQNATTTCSYDLPDVVTYTPADTSCKAALAITAPVALPAGTNMTPYTSAMTAIGGTGPYVWSASGLPAGLTINSASGVISGTPTAAGTSTVTVTVTDSVFATATRTYTLVIN
jgi:large repetitive protein